MKDKKELAVIDRKFCGAVAKIRRQRTALQRAHDKVIVIDEDLSWESLDEALLCLYNLGIDVLRARSYKGTLSVLVAPETSLRIVRALGEADHIGEFYTTEFFIREEGYSK